jgi:VanZ family protein
MPAWLTASPLIRAGYVAIIALATVAEPSSVMAAHAVGIRIAQAVDPMLSLRDLVDAARNLLLFAGWGAVWMMTAPAGPARPILARATLTGAGLSLAAEAFQLIVPTRTPSVVDVLTNTAGAFSGALFAAALVLLVRAGRGARSFVGVPAVVFAGSYGGAVLLDAFSPLFRQDRLIGAWGAPAERFRQAMAELEWSSIADVSPLLILLAAPAGLFAVAALVEAGKPYRTAWRWVALAGAACLTVAELARGAVGHVVSLGPIAAGAAGVALGAWAGAHALPAFSRSVRGAARPRLLWWGYLGVMLLWVLRPFHPELDGAMLAQKLSLERLIPLLSYRERLDLFTVVDVAVTGLLVLPLAGLLAVWPLRLRGWLSGPWPVIYAAAAAECAQVFIAGRWFDGTDLCVQSAAALLGWAIVRRAGYRPYGETLPATSAATGSG